MRDPLQLELDLWGREASQNPQEADQQRELTWMRQQVFTYCWHVKNGHRAWADSYAPSTEMMIQVLRQLKQGGLTFGYQHQATLEALIVEALVVNTAL